MAGADLAAQAVHTCACQQQLGIGVAGVRGLRLQVANASIDWRVPLQRRPQPLAALHLHALRHAAPQHHDTQRGGSCPPALQ
jgi:hypothetical protein